MPRISSKHQVTLPVESLKRAGLRAGDEVAIGAEAPDRIVVRRVALDIEHALGVFEGLYEPDYLERLRARERARAPASSTQMLSSPRSIEATLTTALLGALSGRVV